VHFWKNTLPTTTPGCTTPPTAAFGLGNALITKLNEPVCDAIWSSACVVLLPASATNVSYVTCSHESHTHMRARARATHLRHDIEQSVESVYDTNKLKVVIGELQCKQISWRRQCAHHARCTHSPHDFARRPYRPATRIVPQGSTAR
jgi:hypothetical protein